MRDKCLDCKLPPAESRARCQQHLDRVAAAALKWYKAKSVQGQYTHNLKRYGMTYDDYLALLETQGGVCAICEMPETTMQSNYQNPERPKKLAVDHCHETNRVRGLLCNNCNRALGMLKDDAALLARAAEYLAKAVI